MKFQFHCKVQWSSIFFWSFFLQSFFASGFEVRPEEKFVTIQTPHFEVIVNAKQQELGQGYAHTLESTHSRLKKHFTDFPDKTVVIVNDKTDVTNGYATRIPYPHIMVFPVLPGPTESLAEPGDWAQELLTHEYTHVLTFEPARGVMSYLRPLFGRIVAPNLLLPTWWKEGVAVHFETLLSGHGRLRSLYQEAVIRSLVQQNRWLDFDLAEINEVLPTWPEGLRPYLFGSLLWSQMVADKGDPVVDQLHQRHGGRVPYFVETPARDLLGMNYNSEYRRALHEVQDRAEKQLEQLKKAPFTPVAVFPEDAQYTQAPAISPNGKFLAMITATKTDKRGVKIYFRENPRGDFFKATSWDKTGTQQEAPETPKIYDAPPTGSIQRVSWYPDSSKIIYDRIDAVNSVEQFSDLWIYDLNTKKARQLTMGLRAREPAVSPDGERIAYIQLSAHQTTLALYEPKNKKRFLLKKFDWGERASFPSFWGDSKILFSLRNRQGDEGVFVFDLNNQSITRLWKEFPQARFPLPSTQGLYFTSSRNGVHNLYLSSVDLKKITPVSHLSTLALAPTVDPETQDVYFTQITADGPKLSRLNKKDQWSLTSSLPEASSLWPDRYPVQNSESIEDFGNHMKAAPFPVEEYSGLGKLWPQYWIPFFSTSATSGGIVFEAQTSGFDPLKKHVYNLSVAWDSEVNKTSFSGIYLNQTTPTVYGLQAYQTNTYLVSGSRPLTNTGLAVSASPDVWKWNRYSSLQLSWRHLSTDYSSTTSKRMGPSIDWIYRNFKQSGAQISPDSGGSAQLGATQFIENSDYLSYSQIQGGGQFFWSQGLPELHAVMFRAVGIYTPQKISSTLGASTNSIMPAQETSLSVPVMRGYLTGQFLGRSLINTNLEYRFPLRDIYRGSGTDPLFLRRLHGALVLDGVSVDGVAYRPREGFFEAVSTNRSMWSTGAELRLETTVGYFIPLTLVVGAYDSLSGAYGQGAQVGTSIQISAPF